MSSKKTKKVSNSKKLVKPRRDALYVFPRDWPDRARVQMRYQTHMTMSTLAGGFAYQTFRGNDCYDPDLTNVGKQPVTFDQWAAIYNKIMVTAVSYKIQVITKESAAASQAFHLVVVPSLTSALGSYTFDDLAAQKYSKLKTHDAGAARPLIFNGMYTTDQIFGWQPGRALMDPNNEGQFSSAPSSQWFLSVVLQPADYSSAITAILSVDFTYSCYLFSPKTVSLS